MLPRQAGTPKLTHTWTPNSIADHRCTPTHINFLFDFIVLYNVYQKAVSTCAHVNKCSECIHTSTKCIRQRAPIEADYARHCCSALHVHNLSCALTFSLSFVPGFQVGKIWGEGGGWRREVEQAPCLHAVPTQPLWAAHLSTNWHRAAWPGRVLPTADSGWVTEPTMHVYNLQPSVINNPSFAKHSSILLRLYNVAVHIHS